MVSCTFTRQIAELNGPSVTFKFATTTETILIADDWLTGLKMSEKKEPFGNTGYIGSGTAKRVIYVSKILNLYSRLDLIAS